MKLKLDHPLPENFLLLEYEALWEQRRESTNSQETRLNTYLVVVGGVISLFGAVIQAQELMNKFAYLLPFVACAIFLCVIIFGVITFERMIIRSAEIVFMSLAMEKIRQYFCDRMPLLSEHIIYRYPKTKRASVTT